MDGIATTSGFGNGFQYPQRAHDRTDEGGGRQRQVGWQRAEQQQLGASVLEIKVLLPTTWHGGDVAPPLTLVLVELT
ncbi:hypothetical protein [uncultured Jatrophihabitans sp.]|uniref:hypothetical protein n=1 Tax=uncultured Jatrophihabitans sp. TaxID=1610747 RepID=UPI0035CBCA0C